MHFYPFCFICSQFSDIVEILAVKEEESEGGLLYIQSTLVISTSIILNNCLSQREKSGPCFNTEI